ncbi:MAG: S-layer homology domain-containing protein, partial [Oscillospiraceae bacterium]|nr:S-layer homology domain-containing protein [Oscillospiraceae bacterium]
TDTTMIPGNTAGTNGGGLFIGTSVTFQMTGGEISGNTATSGGGIYVNTSAIATVTDGAISGNTATNGGGVFAASTSSVALKADTMISGNHAATSGGGVYANAATVSIEDGAIFGNTATTGYGAGVCLLGSAGTYTMSGGIIGSTDTTMIPGNTAGTNGGGLYLGAGVSFDLTGGEISGNTADGNGGGIYAYGATVIMDDGSISGNTATVNGGGIGSTSGSTLDMKQGAISGNNAANGGGIYAAGTTIYFKDTMEVSGNESEIGGGVYAAATATAASSLTISDTAAIKDNTARNYAGGVILVKDSTDANVTTAIMSGGEISGNVALRANGGGMYIGQKCSFTMDGGTISGNLTFDPADTSTGGGGGGVYAYNGGTFTLNGGTISDNEVMAGTSGSGGNGGGIFLNPGVTFSMSGGAISGNIANSNTDASIQSGGNGGGIYGSGATLALTGGIISDNYAEATTTMGNGGNGGGVFALGSTVTLANVELSGNEAEIGGALYVVAGSSGNSTVSIGTGTLIQTNTAQYYGGGVVLLQDSSGTYTTGVTMTGGEISGNIALRANGGGVFVGTGCKLTMDAETDAFGNATVGTITGNKTHSDVTNDTTGGDGGGVYVNGTLEMNAGSISANETSYSATTSSGGNGGGVYVSGSGSAVMDGGEITGNSAVSGGGVYVDAGGNGGSFTMTGGSSATPAVTDNTASGNGGGIYLVYGGAGGAMATFDATGTVYITDNTAASGGGIYTEDNIDYSNLNTSSDTHFDDNLAAVAVEPAATTPVNIGYAETSVQDATGTYLSPLNNHDIDYATRSVTYDANGGTGSYQDPAVQQGTVYTVRSNTDTAISRTDYVFTGWNTTADGSGTAYQAGATLTLDDDMTLYAQWSLNIRTVTYNANGGSGSYAESGLVIGSTYAVKSNTETGISRTGYTFTGWNTEKDGSGTRYTAGGTFAVADDTTLYAQWRTKSTGGTKDTDDTTYTVTFLWNDGRTDDTYKTKDVTSGAAVSAPASPNRYGYLFTGWYLDEDGTQIYDFTTKVTKSFSLYADWEEADVVSPYVNGYPNGTFQPEGSLTRAEVAQVMYNLSVIGLGSDATAVSGAAYSDVTSGAWYYQAVTYLAGTGFVHGYSDGTFRPDTPITRGEFSALIIQYLEVSASGTSTFSDVSADDWTAGYIAAAADRGLMSGYSDGTFRPDASITRAEAVTVFNRLLGRDTSATLFDGSAMPFSDVQSGYWGWADIMTAAVEHSVAKASE